jgi:hypothetical protein
MSGAVISSGNVVGSSVVYFSRNFFGMPENVGLDVKFAATTFSARSVRGGMKSKGFFSAGPKRD